MTTVPTTASRVSPASFSKFGTVVIVVVAVSISVSVAVDHQFQRIDRWRREMEIFFERCGPTPRQPLVLFLDDLQWADRSTIELIDLLNASWD